MTITWLSFLLKILEASILQVHHCIINLKEVELEARIPFLTNLNLTFEVHLEWGSMI